MVLLVLKQTNAKFWWIINFLGVSCESTCPQGKYGPNCEQDCNCKNNSSCQMNGECICNRGWEGNDCSKPCDAGYYGMECKEKCLFSEYIYVYIT